MEILWLTQVLPHPPDSGPKVRSRHMIETVARHHDVTLVSFVRGDQRSDVAALRDLCRDVFTVPITRSRVTDAGYLARSILERKPFTILRDDRRSMRELTDRVARGRRFDAVHADQINMVPYAERVPGAARVLDAHNALWLLYKRLQETLPPGPRALALAHEWRLVRRYERRVARDFDAVIAVSRADRDALVGPERREHVTVVPIAIEPEAYRLAGSTGRRILHLGTMSWPPNAEAVRWFASDILPRVRSRFPDIGLDVVGARPPRDVSRLAESDAAIEVPGSVADLDPWIERAGVLVVPLRAGAGMRVKILEAMARGLPVVTTRIGCEGIEVEHQRDVLIADGAGAFAAATARVLEDRELARRLSDNGRRLIRERYDARRVYESVAQLYDALPSLRP